MSDDRGDRDYLTRLVERELGVAPLVKPRIAPRFAVGPEILDNLERDPFREPADGGPAAALEPLARRP
jgi:hypothetical protein